MTIIGLWLLFYLFEFLLFIPFFWRSRRVLSVLMGVGAFISTLALASIHPLLGLVFLPPLIVRLFNFLRILSGRMHEQYLLRASFRTSFSMHLLHVVILTGCIGAQFTTTNNIWLGLLGLQASLALIAFYSVLRATAKLRFKMPEKYLADRDLPTVTVAIPARNETQDLEESIRSVLASDYPKLEILVLDDCSQKKTADIIKSFAHAGVRFLKGEEPNHNWLAKNQAYQKLYKESTGKYVLFCGVDVRFGSGTIRAMINLLHSREKRMLSVLPVRMTGDPFHTVFQPMRYWWELAVPRRLFSRPAVLSTCWMIERQALHTLGGFAAVSRNITPERYFARELVASDSYSFVRSSDDIEVRTQKSLTEQRATTLRVRYPQLHRRPENVLLLTVLQLFVLAGPLITVLFMFFSGNNEYMMLPVAALVAILLTHLTVLQLTNPANIGVAFLTFPIAVIVEISMNIISMFRYEFGTVAWKERNICIPVMHVIPHLPSLTDTEQKHHGRA